MNDSKAAPHAVDARLSRRLKGDLDLIVLKALRKEPPRRYESVEQMAEDLRRHLEGIPVKAAPDSTSYRAGKFVRRHRLGVSATVLIVIAVLGGIAGTVCQERIAAANQHKAESRFNDVRKLANSLMFEIHDSIEALPGSTPARKIIVLRSQEYLDSLAHESSGDLSLQRELATAYEKLGHVQGTATESNLGDARGALQSFRKARTIREGILRSGSARVEDRTALAKTERLIALTLWMNLDDTAGAMETIHSAVKISQQAVADAADDQPAAAELAEDYEQIGDILGGNGVRGAAGNMTDALDNHRRALELWKRLAGLSPSSVARQHRLASAYIGVADDEVKVGSRAEALQFYVIARDLFVPLSQNSNNTLFRRSVALCYSRIGDVLLCDGKPLEALAAYQEDVKIIEPMANADPTDVHLRLKLAGAISSAGAALLHAREPIEGRKLLSRALALTNGLAQNDAQIQDYRAFITVWQGEASQISGDIAAALRQYREALRIYSALCTADSQDLDDQISLSEVHGHLGSAYLQSGDVGQAAAQYGKAYEGANALLSARGENVQVRYALADASAGLGRASAARAEHSKNRDEQSQYWKASQEWYSKSTFYWKQIPNPSDVAPNGFQLVGQQETIAEAKIVADHMAQALQEGKPAATTITSE